MAIRTRLTFWYIGLLAVSLFAFSALLYSLLEGVLTTVLDDRLALQARRVVDLVQGETDPQGVLLAGQAKLPPIDTFGSQYYIQMVNLEGEPVQLSENLRGRSIPLPSGIDEDIAAGRYRSYTADVGDGIQLRVFSTPIILAQQPLGAVQIGLSLVELDGSMAAIRSTMLLGSTSALLLAAAGGVILARAALRPIKAIDETARQITMAHDLDRRIPVAVPNDELGRLTGTINDMLGRLESLFDAQQRLVADVSHELRTPLTTIRGNLELLHRGALEDPTARSEALKAIEDETQRMSRLVNDLLLLAQADAGLKLHLQPVELDTLLLEVYRQTQLTAREVSVRLGGEDQALILGDRDRLRQLLLNLADNAIKYTPAGGVVTLGLQRDGEWVQVSVADTGAGIPPEALPHIFERFYRADRSRARSGGAGLGLAIAQWVAEAHGGRLEVSSQIGQGTTFTLWLPLKNGGTSTSGGEGRYDE